MTCAIAELLAHYPDELEGWSCGKLPTGLAIEELLVKSRLEGLGPNGTPDGYEQLKRYLDAVTGAW